MPKNKCRRPAAQPVAFTLIELLVVIAIIGILAALVLGVGQAVVASAKKSTTQDTLTILDSALAAYMDETDGLPPAFVLHDETITDPAQQEYWPMSDVRNMSFTTPANVPDVRQGNQMVNATGLFIREAEKIPRVKAILDKIPPQYVVQRDVDSVIDTTPGGPSQPLLRVVSDAWGRPIRFVHPSLDGILKKAVTGAPLDLSTDPPEIRVSRDFANSSKASSIRRNAVFAVAPGSATLAEQFPDSDGGRCVGNRPYFYSVGEDGLVGWSDATANATNFNTDNLYSQKPVLPSKP
jgi:prepilin-type N-terminal cleavage/methylation domain-containing protein